MAVFLMEHILAECVTACYYASFKSPSNGSFTSYSQETMQHVITVILISLLITLVFIFSLSLHCHTYIKTPLWFIRCILHVTRQIMRKISIKSYSYFFPHYYLYFVLMTFTFKIHIKIPWWFNPVQDHEVGHGPVLDSFIKWCDESYLQLNVSKTKYMCTDFRRTSLVMPPTVIKGSAVETVG